MFLLIFLAFSIDPETIILKSGKIIKGEVIDHDAESIKIKTDNTQEVILKSKVYKVVYSNNKEIIKKLLEKENETLLKTQQKIENELKNDRTEISKKRIQDKSKTDQTVVRLSKKIEKLEKKISQLKVKIKKLQKTMKMNSKDQEDDSL